MATEPQPYEPSTSPAEPSLAGASTAGPRAGPTTVPTAASSRRERARATTSAEIVTTARRLLVASGPAAVTLRAIAREMGMTAPGLYRYVASHEDLMSVLIAALYHELSDELEAARDAAGHVPGEDEPGDEGGRAERSDPSARVLATSRAFRRWGLAHPAELGLVFGCPVPGYDAPAGGVTHEAGRRFGSVFLGLFAEVWDRAPFPVHADDEIDPRIVGDLGGWVPPGFDLPLGALEVFLRCWMRLYGAVVMESFGQIGFALPDAEPLFELELADLSRLLGLTYRPPSPAR